MLFLLGVAVGIAISLLMQRCGEWIMTDPGYDESPVEQEVKG